MDAKALVNQYEMDELNELEKAVQERKAELGKPKMEPIRHLDFGFYGDYPRICIRDENGELGEAGMVYFQTYKSKPEQMTIKLGNLGKILKLWGTDCEMAEVKDELSSSVGKTFISAHKGCVCFNANTIQVPYDRALQYLYESIAVVHTAKRKAK